MSDEHDGSDEPTPEPQDEPQATPKPSRTSKSARGGTRRRSAAEQLHKAVDESLGRPARVIDQAVERQNRILQRAAGGPAAELARQLEQRDRALQQIAEGPLAAAAKQFEASDRALRGIAAGPLAETARIISESGASIADSPILKTARRLQESVDAIAASPMMKTSQLLAEAGPLADLGKTSRLQEIIEQSNRSASLLQEQASVLREPIAKLPPIGPSAEVEAAWTIQEQLPTLVEISAETSRQIARMAAIAQEGLAESKELRTTMGDYTKEAKRSGDRMTWLTLAIAILTLLLLWKDLELWPFV